MSTQHKSSLGAIVPQLKATLRKAIPFVNTTYHWSVGIYVGATPFSLQPTKECPNPILTPKSVTDIQANLIADPFLIRDGERWYLFAEAVDTKTGYGVIILATSPDCFHWKYEQVVLAEDFHLSYPHVFMWEGNYYMIPEIPFQNVVRLYKATNFPTKWAYEKTLLEGLSFSDPSIFQYGEHWWMFVGIGMHESLYLYYAYSPYGPWAPHPANPIIQADSRIARPGGRVLVHDKRIYRFAQDCQLRYGRQVYAFEITELSLTQYKERPVSDKPLLAPSGRGWNAHGMHQVDIHQLDDGRWVACVDGYKRKRTLGKEAHG